MVQKWWHYFLFSLVMGAGSGWSDLGRSDEGMFPISELESARLKERGLELEPSQLFSPGKPALIDGICRVNGCTGSFISQDGLIITNHHCAYEAIQNASSRERDLLRDGFVARDRAMEIPAPGYTVRITQGYRDVSSDVLSVVEPSMTSLERSKAVEKRRKELEKQSEAENPSLRAEVAEMFTGKTYVLFQYIYLKDVRLVFAPPSSVGNFGGEIDNWEWPRHTGDFSLMRAYTRPDGTAADYSPDNIPYRPKQVLEVEPRGVDEGDFVFIFGYPGRTVRHKTASFIDYEQGYRLPTIVDLYRWQIEVMTEEGNRDRTVAIKHSARMKSLANVEKRSRGQLLGLRRTNLLSARQTQEKELQAFVDEDDDRKKRYGTLLDDIHRVYREMSKEAPLELNLREMRQACRTLSFAFTIFDAAVERAKSDIERETAYMDRNYDQTRQQLMLDVQDLDLATDRILLSGMLRRLMAIESARELPGLKSVLTDEQKCDAWVDQVLKTKLADSAFLKDALAMTPEQLQKIDDPMLQWLIELYPTYRVHRELDKERDGRLGGLYSQLVEIKQQMLARQFIPDANATLRLTTGRIRGYSPVDALYKSPISTLRGVVEKTTGHEPFDTPERILQLAKGPQTNRFVHPRLNDIPVAILYDADTTGGNSGSPVLNARGRLVGVNFDRTFEATINDFAWNEAYSRSIGVDIRYVLWIVGEVFEAGHLLKEIGL